MRAISLAEALKIIEGTFASAKRRKAYPLSAILLDAGGRVKAFHKQDGSSLLRFEIAYGHALAALARKPAYLHHLPNTQEKPGRMPSLCQQADRPRFPDGC